MMISTELANAFNEQIGHEFGASMQYVSIAAHFQRHHLTLLAKLFFDQAEEELKGLKTPPAGWLLVGLTAAGARAGLEEGRLKAVAAK